MVASLGNIFRIINSTGMGRVLMQVGAATPGIDGIKKTLSNMEPSNKMIFTVVRDKNTLDKAIDAVKSLCGDLTEPGKGKVFLHRKIFHLSPL